MIRQLLSGAWEGLKLTWAEWHAIIIGWGDGVAFTETDWVKISILCPNDKGIEGELHYYKFGLGLGRLSFMAVTGGVVYTCIKLIMLSM